MHSNSRNKEDGRIDPTHIHTHLPSQISVVPANVAKSHTHTHTPTNISNYPPKPTTSIRRLRNTTSNTLQIIFIILNPNTIQEARKIRFTTRQASPPSTIPTPTSAHSTLDTPTLLHRTIRRRLRSRKIPSLALPVEQILGNRRHRRQIIHRIRTFPSPSSCCCCPKVHGSSCCRPGRRSSSRRSRRFWILHTTTLLLLLLRRTRSNKRRVGQRMYTDHGITC